MKYIILLTWFFFLACQKETPVEPYEEIVAQPANAVTVYEQADAWYIHAQISSPKDYSVMVKVETKHADGKVWWFFVIIEKGKTQTTVKIPHSAGPVVSWEVGEWGQWE